MKSKIYSSPRLPYWQVKEPGVYDAWEAGVTEYYWGDIAVYEKGGMLRFAHPEKKGVECVVKGMHGWLFRRRNVAMEALPAHPTT